MCIFFPTAGMDGRLEARLGSGNHVIQISQLAGKSHVELVDGGNLLLKIPENCPFGVDIEAESISLPDTMNRRGVKNNGPLGEAFVYQINDSHCIKIKANNARVVVEHQDWLSSLGISWK